MQNHHCDGKRHFEEWRADLQGQEGAWAVFDKRAGAYINPALMKMASKSHGLNGCGKVIASLTQETVQTLRAKLNGQRVTVTGMTDRCSGCPKGCPVIVAKVSRTSRKRES